MIRGIVTREREAVIPLRIFGPSDTIVVEAIIDTGFNDNLALPSEHIEALGLPFEANLLATLADGENVETSSYNCTVLWDDRPLEILAIACEGGPLIGMSLIYGHDLHIEAIDGGQVTIERRA